MVQDGGIRDTATAADTPPTPTDPRTVQHTLVVRGATAVGIVDGVDGIMTEGMITADLLIRGSLADVDLLADTVAEDMLSLTQGTADRIAAEPGGHRISRTIV